VAFPSARSDLRLAAPGDIPAIERIAAGAFHHGRYHADSGFPRKLADRRYQQWIANALRHPNPEDRVYVLASDTQVDGFYHVTVQDDVADLRLAALSPELQGTLLGVDLYVSMMHVLKALGIRRISTSISAANTGVLNVYSLLGFHFSEPELLFHRHNFQAAR